MSPLNFPGYKETFLEYFLVLCRLIEAKEDQNARRQTHKVDLRLWINWKLKLVKSNGWTGENICTFPPPNFGPGNLNLGNPENRTGTLNSTLSSRLLREDPFFVVTREPRRNYFHETIGPFHLSMSIFFFSSRLVSRIFTSSKASCLKMTSEIVSKYFTPDHFYGPI